MLIALEMQSLLRRNKKDKSAHHVLHVNLIALHKILRLPQLLLPKQQRLLR